MFSVNKEFTRVNPCWEWPSKIKTFLVKEESIQVDHSQDDNVKYKMFSVKEEFTKLNPYREWPNRIKTFLVNEEFTLVYPCWERKCKI